MSEPTRYTAVGNGVVRTDPEGLLIAYGHYVELKAEVENLRKNAEINTLQSTQELVRLRASSFVTAVPSHQYERVVMAGDAMLSEWASGDEKDAKNFLKALVIWNAAKEGKQS